jgi:ribosomal-protein-alanine N-acetyltransferase
MDINRVVFSKLETERLVLRQLKISDVEALFDMRKEPLMHVFTDTKPDVNLEETMAYLMKMNLGIEEGKWLIWAIQERSSGRMVGSISLWNFDLELNTAELGYGLVPTAWGFGYMEEALGGVLHYGFDVLGLSKIEAYTEASNVASVKLLKKYQFEKTGQVEEQGYTNDRMYIMEIYQLARSL